MMVGQTLARPSLAPLGSWTPNKCPKDEGKMAPTARLLTIQHDAWLVIALGTPAGVQVSVGVSALPDTGDALIVDTDARPFDWCNV